jgi:hypothetical protein
MIIKTEKPVWLSRERKLYMYEWNLPFIPQYQGYERSWHFSCPHCNNNMGAEWEEVKGIVGYSEDSFGDILVMHECPTCGTKWYNHLSHGASEELNRAMLEDQLISAESYGVGNSALLIKKEEVNR